MTESHAPKSFSVSIRGHRFAIGVLGLLLPFILVFMAAGRSEPGPERWQLLDSVSAYYYTGAVGVFVGVIFSLSLFLFTYPGYQAVLADRIFGWIGGLAAIGVALFPTEAPPAYTAPGWWGALTGKVHVGAAVTLFLSFIVFALVLFPKSKERWKDQPLEKNVRNVVFYVCGVVMIGAVVCAGVRGLSDRSIFAPEVVALWAFAISWLVKAEIHKVPGELRRWRAR